MGFPTMWYVRPAKPQISLRIRAVWSEPLLVAWIFYECQATDWTSFVVSQLKMRLHRPVWDYTCQNATLLEITCRGSNVYSKPNERAYSIATGAVYTDNFANSLDQDLDPNCLTLWQYSYKNFSKKLILKKNQQTTKTCKITHWTKKVQCTSSCM